MRIAIRQGRGGRHRWFAIDDNGRIVYSSFPNSFAYEQQAWEDAEWAVGVAVYMTFKPEDPDEGFTNYAASRTFDSL